MILTKLELEELTGKKNRDAQVRALRSIGIEHKVRADGGVIVLRTHAEKILSNDIYENKKTFEPNWSAM